MRSFTVLQRHLILLRHANVGWDDCEHGAPCIDPKRPYGNSDVESDIHQLVGKPADARDDEGEWPEGVRERYQKLHRETQTVLQIVLATGEFRAGMYVADDYSRNWRLVT